MRTLLVWMTLLFALPALTAPAQAASPVKEARKEAREAKRLFKKMDRAIHRWDRAERKGKARKMARQDRKIRDVYRAELARLRARGIASRIPQPTRHPSGLQNAYKPSRPAEAYRDALVGLRDLQRQRARGKGYRVKQERALMYDVRERLGRRMARAKWRVAKVR